MKQHSLPLSVPALPGESRWSLRTREMELRNPTKHVPEEKLLADLLKRQARAAMREITECPPDTIAAHLTRLDGLRELFRFMLAHQYKHTREALPSAAQLVRPHTLADYLACLEITRTQHRAPCFVSTTDEELQAIHRKLDTLAGLFANHPAIETLLTTEAA